jgi:MFS family permease
MPALFSLMLFPSVAAGASAADADLCRCGFFWHCPRFFMPAGASLVPLLVPIDKLPKAIAWNTFSVQSGMILGPWIGGVLCELAPVYANATECALYLLACAAWVILVRMALEARPIAATLPAWRSGRSIGMPENG